MQGAALTLRSRVAVCAEIRRDAGDICVEGYVNDFVDVFLCTQKLPEGQERDLPSQIASMREILQSYEFGFDKDMFFPKPTRDYLDLKLP